MQKKMPDVPMMSVRAAYDYLQDHPEAVLLDVRTEPEWDFVGVPLIPNIIQVEWRKWPDMQRNPDFLEELKMLDVGPERHLLCMCKCGGRSHEAALFLLQNGYHHCWNIPEGFEGDLDGYGHRRCVNGWVAEGLPWVQC